MFWRFKLQSLHLNSDRLTGRVPMQCSPSHCKRQGVNVCVCVFMCFTYINHLSTINLVLQLIQIISHDSPSKHHSWIKLTCSQYFIITFHHTNFCYMPCGLLTNLSELCFFWKEHFLNLGTINFTKCTYAHIHTCIQITYRMWNLYILLENDFLLKCAIVTLKIYMS